LGTTGVLGIRRTLLLRRHGPSLPLMLWLPYRRSCSRPSARAAFIVLVAGGLQRIGRGRVFYLDHGPFRTWLEGSGWVNVWDQQRVQSSRTNRMRTPRRSSTRIRTCTRHTPRMATLSSKAILIGKCSRARAEPHTAQQAATLALIPPNRFQPKSYRPSRRSHAPAPPLPGSGTVDAKVLWCATGRFDEDFALWYNSGQA
jgi:hypothetical protein